MVFTWLPGIRLHAATNNENYYNTLVHYVVGRIIYFIIIIIILYYYFVVEKTLPCKQLDERLVIMCNDCNRHTVLLNHDV